MIASNDGGVTVRSTVASPESRGQSAHAQFYHVTTDTRTPYYVYGAQQDNTTIAIASRMTTCDWPSRLYAVGGGEAGYIAPYPPDPFIVYAGDYQGTLSRYDRHTGQTKSVTASLSFLMDVAPRCLTTASNGPRHCHFSARSQCALPRWRAHFQTTDGGMHWEAISDDLTRNDKSKQQISAAPSTKTTPARSTTTPSSLLSNRP